jgi:hypothetical protein
MSNRSETIRKAHDMVDNPFNSLSTEAIHVIRDLLVYLDDSIENEEFQIERAAINSLQRDAWKENLSTMVEKLDILIADHYKVTSYDEWYHVDKDHCYLCGMDSGWPCDQRAHMVELVDKYRPGAALPGRAI